MTISVASHRAGALLQSRRLRGSLAAAAMLGCFFASAVSTEPTAAQAKFTEEGGTLPDGTVFLMRVPPDWNRTLIRDLDWARAANDGRSQYLLARGYALAGTSRHSLRAFRYDPVQEIGNLDAVLDRFEARFGRPRRVIQYGCSGGGYVALAVAENFSDRVDGSIALAAYTPVSLMNTFLDGWFALKTLIGPASAGDGSERRNLFIVKVPDNQDNSSAWRQAIDAAQSTPEGRARIALAFAIGQWPAWVNGLTPPPSLDDVAALQHSMYHALFQSAAIPGGTGRRMFENAANGQGLSWNTGVDYREFFENGNEHFKRAVRQLYDEAGLDLEADLNKINTAPRVMASPYALDFWSQPRRTARGNPRIPLLRMAATGDHEVPLSLVQGYETQVAANEKGDLFRTAFVSADGHCRFTLAESAAAIEIMMRRLDTGRWTSTDPDELNTLAASLGTSTTARFTAIDKLRQGKYNRTWPAQ